MDKTNLEQALYDCNVYDAWQFVSNTLKTMEVAEYCMNVISSVICRMDTEHADWLQRMWDNAIVENCNRIVSVTSEDLNPNTIFVADIEVSKTFLINKLIKDFFQYCRNVYDSIAQVTNAGCLASSSYPIEKIDFPFMQRKLQSKTYSLNFPELGAWFTETANSNEYKYIDAFCNRTKHTCDVSLNVSLNLLGGKNTTAINPFYKKQQQHGTKDIREYLSTVFDFVRESYHEFIDAFWSSFPKKLHAGNRFHQLNCIQQKLRDNPESNYAIIYIEEDELPNRPEEIQVLLANKQGNGEIRCQNCPYDNIYIHRTACESLTEFVAKYVADDLYVDDSLVKYRRYRKAPEKFNPGYLTVQAITEWNKKFLHANPYISIKTRSDDEEFMKRVQFPF